MKLGIMQPYFFPYIGYFQLIDAVDRFVFYDDVTYIKQGWINRNRILHPQKGFNYFTVPLKHASSFQAINQTLISENETWRSDLFRKLENVYKKAPFFSQTSRLFVDVVSKPATSISDLSQNSVLGVLEYLDIKTEIVRSSSKYNNGTLKGQSRIIDICQVEKADVYINAEGGRGLYSPEDFSSNGIKLCFIKAHEIKYNQGLPSFSSFLSILDVLMFNSPEATRSFLKACSFI